MTQLEDGDPGFPDAKQCKCHPTCLSCGHTSVDWAGGIVASTARRHPIEAPTRCVYCWDGTLAKGADGESKKTGTCPPLPASSEKYEEDFCTKHQSAAFEGRQKWMRLFRSYGTHYTDQVVLGGKMILKYIDQQAVNSAKKKGWSVARRPA